MVVTRIRKRSSLWLAAGALLLLAAACTAAPDPGAAQLVFRAPMNVDSGQRFHVSLGVENQGDRPFRDYQGLNGAMILRNEAGDEVGRVQVATLWELAPGEVAWPGAFAAQLPAGAYRLTWGAPAYGSVTVDFTIVEHEGRLYLGEEVIKPRDGEPAADAREHGAFQSLVDLARVDLSQRLGVDFEAVTVQSIEEVEFPDASLGVPEPGQQVAQVLTPGLIITLTAGGETYEYHASDSRMVYAPAEEAAPEGSITINEVQVDRGEQVMVRGVSTLPGGTCLGSELWADGEPQAWWPGDACVPVEGGSWQMTVPLGEGDAPAELDASAQYMLRVFQQGGPNIVAVFPFDLAGPPTPAP